MNVFEYATGLISIVVGLAIARILGGVGNFTGADKRTADDWIVLSWSLALALNLVGWWIGGWKLFSGHAEIGVLTLFAWIITTSFLYLAAYVLIPNTAQAERGEGARPPSAFYLFLAAHFATSVFLVFGVSDQGLTAGSLVIFVLAVVTAAGAAANSNWARIAHLVLWLVLMAVVLGGQAIGSEGPP